MIISVANPIYDSVFKFLMEDECFSALDQMEAHKKNGTKPMSARELLRQLE